MTAPADNTPISVISDAYFDAGLLMEGQTPSSEQIVTGMRRLTDLINFEQTQGIKLWLNVDQPVVLTAGQGTYTLMPGGDVDMAKPLRVIQALYIQPPLTGTTPDFQGIRRPLVPLAWDDYYRLSQVNQQGAINSYFVNKKAAQLDVFFWLIPDTTAATGICRILLQTQVTNFISVTETMNFPIEWRLFLRWALAEELATGQPAAVIERCQSHAERYREALEGWDVEDAPTRFTPDQRVQYYQGRFR